jgi:hypothetical protein
VSVLCDWMAVNRAGYYRWRTPRRTQPAEMELRDAVQQIAAKFPAYGYRRITPGVETRRLRGQSQARVASDGIRACPSTPSSSCAKYFAL